MIQVPRAFRGHSKKMPLSHRLLFPVCCFLHTVHTADIQIGLSGVDSISIALQSNTSLKSLDISGVLVCSHLFHTAGNNIGDSGAESISRALQSNTSLKLLIISCVLFCLYFSHTTGNQIGYPGAESISRALQSNTSLKSLDISSVKFVHTHFTHFREQYWKFWC